MEKLSLLPLRNLQGIQLLLGQKLSDRHRHPVAEISRWYRVEFDGNIAETLRAAIARLGRVRRKCPLFNPVASYRDPLETENLPIRQLCGRWRPGSTGLPPHRR